MSTLLWKRCTNIIPKNSFSAIMFPQLLFSMCLPPQWMFLQLNPLWDGPIKQLLADADTWLCKRRTGKTGLQLVSVFPHRLKPICWNGFALQTCVRKSPSWTQKMVCPSVQCSSTFVSSISSTIWHLHASWRETTFCLPVRTKMTSICCFCSTE